MCKTTFDQIITRTFIKLYVHNMINFHSVKIKRRYRLSFLTQVGLLLPSVVVRSLCLHRLYSDSLSEPQDTSSVFRINC